MGKWYNPDLPNNLDHQAQILVVFYLGLLLNDGAEARQALPDVPLQLPMQNDQSVYPLFEYLFDLFLRAFIGRLGKLVYVFTAKSTCFHDLLQVILA